MSNLKPQTLFVAVRLILAGMGIAMIGLWVCFWQGFHSSKVYEPLSLFVLGLGGLAGFGVYRISGRKIKPVGREGWAPSAKTEAVPMRSASILKSKAIFVSYRRDDSADVTGRLYDRLSSHFGTDSVFKDVDSEKKWAGPR